MPVINPVAAYRVEKSKALQLGLFERVGARYPRTVVVNHPDQRWTRSTSSAFPSWSSRTSAAPARASSGSTREPSWRRALDRLDLGPDGTALVQEYLESDEGAIVRVEVLDGRYLYAIRIVRDAEAGFNLCPADICQVPRTARPAALDRACPGAPPPASPSPASTRRRRRSRRCCG